MSSSKKKRRQWSAKEKLRIVLSGLESGVEVSELCRREGISPTQFYNWKSQLVGSADAVFGDRRTKKNGQRVEDPREEELTKLRGVIAEITAENLELKKTRSD
jgi:transposase